jgi:hypothetical protein
MFCRALFICSSLAGSVPLASHAQTASRFYAGVGANLLTNVPFNSANVSRLVGPSLTVGVQVASRVALQTAATYQWQSESYTSPIYTYGGGYIGGETSSSRYRYITVPVLLRYTVTPAARHFLFDGLAGITIRHSTHQQNYPRAGRTVRAILQRRAHSQWPGKHRSWWQLLQPFLRPLLSQCTSWRTILIWPTLAH